jgi:drug/metabolite transporter (DMT)-like permease
VKKPPVDVGIFGALAATIVFWASAFPGIRASMEAYGPGQVALLRLLVASAVLLAYAALTGMRLPDRRDLPVVALGGFLAFAVYHTALNYGELTVSSGPAAVVVNTAPLFTALLATVFLGERLKVLGWVGMVVSFGGAVLIGLGEGGGVGLAPGMFLILISAVSVSVYLVLQKPYLAKYGALAFTSYTIWAGTLFSLVFLPGLLAQLPQASSGATLSALYLGVFPTALAYVTYARAMSRLPASRGASYLYLVAPTAFLVAWIWLGEVPTLLSVLGAAVVLAGVTVVNAFGRERA